MIKVDVETKDDGFMNIKVNGHGNSSVCSSVSTLLQSNVRFMQELAKQYPNDIQVNLKEEE